MLILGSDYSLECFEHIRPHAHIFYEIFRLKYNKRMEAILTGKTFNKANEKLKCPINQFDFLFVDS